MLYQFLDDAVIALFGLPDKANGYGETALDCACALVEIGQAVSSEWQRQIDRMQASGGVHIGMAIGVQIMSLRRFSRAHMGAIGDCIKMTARLDAAAGSGEIVVEHVFQRFPWRSGLASMSSSRWRRATSGAFAPGSSRQKDRRAPRSPGDDGSIDQDGDGGFLSPRRSMRWPY